MSSIQDKIQEIEEEIRRTPYNKATQQHIGRLKAKLSKLRDEGDKTSSGTGGAAYAVKKSGDATVVLVGFPSVGKSTLLNRLTNAESEVGGYDFTTIDVIPGAMEYRGAQIQILDVPGLIAGASSGKGRGREVISVIRNSDLILFILDIFNISHLKVLEDEINRAGIRVNKRPPAVRIKKTSRGGLRINSTVPLTRLDFETVKNVLSEYRIHNGEVLIREDISIDELIDAIAKNRVYVKSVVVVNKIDLAPKNLLNKVKKELPDSIFISADKGVNMETFKETIYKHLGFIHVFMKPQGGEADFEEPLVVKEGSTVEDVCNRLHKGFRKRFRFARVWGPSVRFDGQRTGLEHRLLEGDVLSIVLEK